MLPERRTDAGYDLSGYSFGGEQAVFWEAGWWELYGDEQLNFLMKRAFFGNPGLNQIRARLVQAKAVTRQSRSGLFPTLDISGERSKFDGDPGADSDFDLRGAARFEIDLWGENRSRTKSSKLLEKATQEDLYAAAITLSATITQTWLEILSLREQEAIIRKQVDVNRTVLDLQERRFEQGSAVALDVLQQEENLARSEALLPDILSAQVRARNNLAVLIGLVPSNDMQIADKPLPAPLDIPATGLPSDLLNDRPDIVAAWNRLISADWAARAAFTDRLPRFDLSATYTSDATRIGDLFDSWLLDLAASVAAPIIDGGRRRGVQLQEEARADENFYLYQDAVLQAVLDVENTLTQNVYQDQKLSALRKQLEASYKTLEQAQFSYANGESDYINVLTSLTNSQALEQQIELERLVQAQARVNLYRALGGRSWAAKEMGDE